MYVYIEYDIYRNASMREISSPTGAARRRAAAIATADAPHRSALYFARADKDTG